MHDKIVPLKERFEESARRHKKFFEMIKTEDNVDYREINKKVGHMLEEDIFGKIDINPEDINELE